MVDASYHHRIHLCLESHLRHAEIYETLGVKTSSSGDFDLVCLKNLDLISSTLKIDVDV